MNEKKVRVNEQIQVSPIRLIDEEGKQVGVIPIEEALRLAENAHLDLVEVSPTAKPPVCRIMDYGKFKYEISKKVRTARKHRHVIHVKEIKLRSEISDHDFEFKMKHAEEFFQRGDKVKFTLVFRGREALHRDIGEEVLKRVTQALEDKAAVESGIRSEGRNLMLIMAPK
ncbi:MAG: translation initiation factor IF-3 [Candidatus Latescibacterota bacterium]